MPYSRHAGCVFPTNSRRRSNSVFKKGQQIGDLFAGKPVEQPLGHWRRIAQPPLFYFFLVDFDDLAGM